MFTSTESGILRFPRQIAISALSITVNWVRTFIRGRVDQRLQKLINRYTSLPLTNRYKSWPIVTNVDQSLQKSRPIVTNVDKSSQKLTSRYKSWEAVIKSSNSKLPIGWQFSLSFSYSYYGKRSRIPSLPWLNVSPNYVMDRFLSVIEAS